MTQKSKIYNYLKQNPRWFKSYELQTMAIRQFGCSPETAIRRTREMSEPPSENNHQREPVLERRRVGRYEEYRFGQTISPAEVAENLKDTFENERLFDAPVAKRKIRML
jgi:hypothetical protein